MVFSLSIFFLLVASVHFCRNDSIEGSITQSQKNGNDKITGKFKNLIDTVEKKHLCAH